jgi:hypothetical protein
MSDIGSYINSQFAVLLYNEFRKGRVVKMRYASGIGY